MKFLLWLFSSLFLYWGIGYILAYTLTPNLIPSWLSFTPGVSTTILLLWAVNLVFYLHRLSKR